jgi:hypothetical protein
MRKSNITLPLACLVASCGLVLAANCVYEWRDDGVCGTPISCDPITKLEVICDLEISSCVDGVSWETCTVEVAVGKCHLVQHIGSCEGPAKYVGPVSTNDCPHAITAGHCSY